MPSSQVILLTGGTLIDGSGSDPQPQTDLAMQADCIIGIGTEAAEVAAAATAQGAILRTLDVTGRTVMPGLIDAHCHITFGEPSSNDELFFHRQPSTAMLLAAFNVPKLLRAGVTGFLDADCISDLGPALRDGINAGLVQGPRMVSGMNALLTSAGGTAGRLIPDSGSLGYAQVVGTKDEMVRLTRQQIKYGADWIKIHVTGSLPNQVGEATVWSLEELRVVTETAHALNTPVLAHCRSAHSTRLAALAGVDLILHGSYMDEAALEAVLESGAALAPTFTFLANLADFGSAVGAGSSQIDMFRGEIQSTAVMMLRAHREGVRLLCGSESGFSLTPYGHWHARELELFVTQVGLTPLEAITCATRNGALALKMTEGTVGMLRKGAVGDVLVVNGNPAADISVLGDHTKLQHVFSRGVEVNLGAPWPTRQTLPGEQVARWSEQLLTQDIARTAGSATSTAIGADQ